MDGLKRQKKAKLKKATQQGRSIFKCNWNQARQQEVAVIQICSSKVARLYSGCKHTFIEINENNPEDGVQLNEF